MQVSKRVVVAMSGGVDSSVAARLMLERGYDVVGVFMRHGVPADDTGHSATCRTDSRLPILDFPGAHKQGCCTAADAEDARRVAHNLGIPFYALNLQDGFDRIIDYFVAEYVGGRTPNPCVMCNNWLKFGKLFDYADGIGAEYVATGHYARVMRANTTGETRLLRGIDQDKDQSYVLFGIDRHLLERILLPVGEFHKSQVRAMAAEVGLRVAEKKDSQEICFVPAGRHADFVRGKKGPRETSGRIVTVAGDVVGSHDGIERFTIGQRRGLGVAMGERYFVVRIDPLTNNVVIGRREDLARDTLAAVRANWLVEMPDTPLRCLAQIRYNSIAKPAVMYPSGADRFTIVFDEPRHGVAPGQAVVCYEGERVLGGGWIV
jgi:tRNA-specific 2-thiouridylase